jgi:hypothetical protein
MPARAACDHFVPHLFLSNNRCRDCDFPESEHVAVSAASPRGRAPTLEQKVDILVRGGCTHYTPHAWIVDRCRDCGRREALHETSAGNAVNDDEADGGRRQVGSAPLRREAEIAALGLGGSRRGSQNVGSAMNLRRGKKGAAGSAGSDAQFSSASSLEQAQRVLDQAVAQMVLMGEELEDVKAQEADSLQSNSITQAEYDAKMAELEAAFQRKEAELKAQVEQAKEEIEEAQQQLKLEQEEEAKREDEQQAQLQQARAEADKAKEEAAALRAEAAAAASKAEQDREERDRVAQEELERARAEAANARLEAEAARAETQAQREEQERRDRAAAEAAAEVAAQAAAAAEAAAAEVAAQKEREREEVKEQEAQVSISAPVFPSTSGSRVGSITLPRQEDEDEVQPTAATAAAATKGPYRGTVNLSDVLLKVEKLFLSGKSFFRFSYSRQTVVVCALFLRVIDDEYVLCWSRGGQRNVHNTRTMPFSSIQEIVVGKQSSVFRRPEFAEAAEAQCLSIIGREHCLHLMAGNDRDAEMTSFGLASLLKESRINVKWCEPGQYQEADNAVITETTQEQAEEDDGAQPADLHDLEQLTSLASSTRVSVHLSVKCSSLPLVHQNVIVCLVDREEKTDRLVYVSQTERVSRNANPEFSREFVVEYELGSVRELRFNVYDVSVKSQSIDDADRLGSLKADIREMVELDGVDFVFRLQHREHSKSYKLIKAQSQITICCRRKEAARTAAAPGGYNSSRLEVDDTQLASLQQMLVKGDIFTMHVEQAAPQPVTVYYRTAAAAAASSSSAGGFALGNLHYTVMGDSGAVEAQSVPLRSICDVYMGKKQRSFSAQAADDCCFSLLSKTGVRLDLEAKSAQQRDDFVNAITALLKHATMEAKKKAQARLGMGSKPFM